MTSNFNYGMVQVARKSSKRFCQLDNKMRAMAIALAKDSNEINQTEYLTIKKQRDELLYNLINDQIDLQQPQFDLTLYKKIDKQITSKLDAFMAKFPKTKLKNVVFQGPTGTGKTYCSKVIAQDLQTKGYNVHFTSTYSLVKRLNDSHYGQDHAAPTDFFDSDLLIIDDLGAEPTVKNSDEFLYTVINERYANNRPFIITTNLSTEQLLSRYDERLFGRIFDQTRTAVITFAGKDLRIE